MNEKTILKNEDFEKVSNKEYERIFKENTEVYEYGYTEGTIQEINQDISEIESDGFRYNIAECYTNGTHYIMYND